MQVVARPYLSQEGVATLEHAVLPYLSFAGMANITSFPWILRPLQFLICAYMLTVTVIMGGVYSRDKLLNS